MPRPQFGKLLRATRQEASKTLGSLARAVGVSTVYVSDVERGRRAPFSTDNIVEAARFLEVDAGPLLRAAAEERGVFEVNVSGASPSAMSALAGLARKQVTDISDATWEEIMKILNKEADG